MSEAAAAAVPAKQIDFAAIAKEAGATALVALVLAVGLVGFKIEDVSGGLAIVTRFPSVVTVAALVFIGRAALVMQRQGFALPPMGLGAAVALYLMAQLSGIVGEIWLPFPDPVENWLVAIIAAVLAAKAALQHFRPEAADKTIDLGAEVNKVSKYLAPVLLLAALAFPFTPAADRQLLDIAVLVITYIMLGWGLNVVVGLAGLLDLGYVAFYAVGAYSYALLAQYFGLGFWICLPFAGIMAAFAGILLGFPVLRLRGDYLAIVTLGFGEIIRVILLNWYDFTGGPDGISGIPKPTLFGLEFARSAADGGETFHSFFGLEYASIDKVIFLYYLIIGLELVTNFFTLRIRKMPIGRAWEALREDEIACRSLGINPTNTKLTAFAIGAGFAGFAGSFFATRQGFISPESFSFIESAVILAIVVLGGMGSQIGVVLAAVILIGLPEFFRELQEYRMLAFGGAMVLIMLWRPAGLLAHREPTVRLHAKGDGAQEERG